MITQAHKRIVTVSGLVGVIIVIFLLLWEKDLSVQKRAGTFEKSKSDIQNKRVNNPCNTTDGDQTRTRELYFCYQNNATQAVFTFQNPSKIGGYNVDSWKKYDWYLEYKGNKPLQHWDRRHVPGSEWGNVFATTGSWNKGSYGFTSTSEEWKKNRSQLPKQIIK